MSEEDLNLLEKKKNRLNEKRKHKIVGVMIRSRCRYEDLEGKTVKLLLNFEKRNFTNKVITKFVDDNGQESLSTEEILNSQKNIFKNLYSENILIDDTPIEAQIGVNNLKMTKNEAESLEGNMKYSELAEALKNEKLKKSRK